MDSQSARTEEGAKEAQLEVVRDVGGRPLFLNARRFIRICRWIEQGESASEACRLELVSYSGFRRHVSRSEKYQARLQQAIATREEFLREYHIANVKKHAPRNVLASLWWLERRYPNQFALRTVNRNLNSDEKTNYSGLTRAQLLELLEASRVVEAEAPKGFNSEPPMLTENSSQTDQK